MNPRPILRDGAGMGRGQHNARRLNLFFFVILFFLGPPDKTAD